MRRLGHFTTQPRVLLISGIAILVGTAVPLAHPDEYLEGVITRMVKTNAAHVPVISRADSRLVGYLSWRDLLRAWEQAKQQEERRTLFYRFLGGARGQAAPDTGNPEKT